MLLMIDVMRSIVMKRHWQIRRQFQPTADGARRWDQAYQSLLEWTASHALPANATPAPLHQPQTEDIYENSHLCPCVDRAVDAGTNHRTAGRTPHGARACPRRDPTDGGYFS